MALPAGDWGICQGRQPGAAHPCSLPVLTQPCAQRHAAGSARNPHSRSSPCSACSPAPRHCITGRPAAPRLLLHLHTRFPCTNTCAHTPLHAHPVTHRRAPCNPGHAPFGSGHAPFPLGHAPTPFGPRPHVLPPAPCPRAHHVHGPRSPAVPQPRPALRGAALHAGGCGARPGLERTSAARTGPHSDHHSGVRGPLAPRSRLRQRGLQPQGTVEGRALH